MRRPSPYGRWRSPFGWTELILGILLLATGIFLIVRPVVVLGGFVLAYAVGLIVVGIADIVFYVRLERYTGIGPVVSLVAGIINILAGVLLAVNTQFGVLVLAVMFPIGLMAHSVARLLNLDFVKRFGSGWIYWLSLAVGVLGLVLGIMLLVNPLASVQVLRYVVGGYLVLLGGVRTATAVSRLGG